ncbi:peptidyl-glycine alpha-amidating monooxygenase isoform X4 [Hydra vulgaris]|uniref:Peptidyl-glycine alpha-amidating monooxygenase isoform X4 n=1 Tax=Hydra vulgaris TaxID=6087 RepID=A0ABM4DDZ9_HYDVU
MLNVELTRKNAKMNLCLYLSAIFLLKPYLIICYITDLEVKLPLISPKKEGYLCTFESIDLDKIYAINFEPSLKNRGIVDHMLLYGCKEPIRKEYYWECDQTIPCAQQNGLLLYVWNKNSLPFKLPKNVGYQLGTSNNIEYLVLQVHYNNFISENQKDESGVLISYTSNPPKFLGGIFIFNPRVTSKSSLKDGGNINSGNSTDIVIDMELECTYHGDPIIAFAYTGYSFNRGLTSAYITRNGDRYLIGQLNALHLQGFTMIPKGNRSLIHSLDILAAHTIFNVNNTEFLRIRKKQVFTFYLAYYKVNTGNNFVIDGCYHIKSFTWSNAHLLKGASLDKNAHANTTLLPFIPSMISKNNVFKSSRFSNYSKNEKANLSLVTSKSDKLPESIETFPLPVFVKTWKLKDDILSLIANVTSVAVSNDGSIIILSSAGVSMDVDLFDEENYYIGLNDPIKENIIFILNADGSLNKTFGKNLFIMPVRLKTSRHNDSIWVIDIGLHQIFKFSMKNLLEPILTLGERPTPGFDNTHFCQPSDIVITKSFIFVADGYCNHRIIKFDANGKFLKDFTSPPGSVKANPLALASDDNGELLYVAYRYSILVFKTDGSLSHVLVKETEHLEFHSIAFSSLQGGVLFALYNSYGEATQGLTLNAQNGNVLNTWFKNRKVFNGSTQICLSTYEKKLYLAVNNEQKILQYYIQSYMEEFPNVNRSFVESSEDVSSEDGVALVPIIVVVIILATPIVLVAILVFIQFVCKRKKRNYAIRERELSRSLRYKTMFFGCCATPKYRYSADRGFDKFLNDGSYCSDEDENENLFTRKT